MKQTRIVPGMGKPATDRPGAGRLIGGLLLIFVLLQVGGLHDARAQDRPDALVLYRQGRFQEAVNITLRELEENAANLDAYTVLGWSLLALNRVDDALEYGRRGLRVSRFDPRIIHIVGEALYRAGNYLDALQYLQDYAALAPAGRQIDQVYYLMGEVFLRFEEYNHADAAFSKAVYLNGNRSAWWVRLGFAREMAGSTDAAIVAYQEALQRTPNLPEARAALERLATADD